MKIIRAYSIEQTRFGNAKIHRVRVPMHMHIGQVTRAICGSRAPSSGWDEAGDDCTLPLCKRCYPNQEA